MTLATVGGNVETVDPDRLHDSYYGAVMKKFHHFQRQGGHVYLNGGPIGVAFTIVSIEAKIFNVKSVVSRRLLQKPKPCQHSYYQEPVFRNIHPQSRRFNGFCFCANA